MRLRHFVRRKVLPVRQCIRLGHGSHRRTLRFVRRKITVARQGIRLASDFPRCARLTQPGRNVSRRRMLKAGPTPARNQHRGPRFDHSRDCNHRTFRNGPMRGQLPEIVSIERGTPAGPEPFRTTEPIEGHNSRTRPAIPAQHRRTMFSRNARPTGSLIGTGVATIGGTGTSAGS